MYSPRDRGLIDNCELIIDNGKASKICGNRHNRFSQAMVPSRGDGDDQGGEGVFGWKETSRDNDGFPS